MELVMMELFLLIVVVSIVVNQKGTSSLFNYQDVEVVSVASAYIGYLALAVLSPCAYTWSFPIFSSHCAFGNNSPYCFYSTVDIRLDEQY